MRILVIEDEPKTGDYLLRGLAESGFTVSLARNGRDGLHMADMRYRAVFSLESFTGNPSRLMALVGSWLETHDSNRDRHELPAPMFTVEPLDQDSFDVELSLEFIEPQYLAEDPTGEIEAFGKTLAFVPFDLWVAEQGEVGSDGR